MIGDGMADKLSDAHPSFTSLASCLGGVGQMHRVGNTSYAHLPDFTLNDGGVVIRALPHTGSKGGLSGAYFSIETSSPAAPVPIVLRRERWFDRLGSRLAINKEVALGDPRFDGLVYIESDGDETTVWRVLSDPRAREACVDLVTTGVVAKITIADAHPSFALSERHSVQIEIPKSRFDDVPAIKQATAALVRLTRAVVESARSGDPYRGMPGAVGGVLPTRTARGVALVLVGLATWVGLLIVAASNPPTFGMHAYGIGACAGVVLWLVLGAIAIALLRHRSTSLRNVCGFAVWALGAIPLGGSAAVACNHAFVRAVGLARTLTSSFPSAVFPGT